MRENQSDPQVICELLRIPAIGIHHVNVIVSWLSLSESKDNPVCRQETMRENCRQAGIFGEFS